MLNKRDVLEKHFGTRDWAEIEKLWLEQDTSSYVTLPPKSLPLPYSLPANELLAPIPTVEEISKQANTENDLTGKTSLVNCQVYKVNGYAVKFAGTPKLLQEAENHLFIQQNTTIRIPKLYGVFSQASDPRGIHSDLPELPTYYYLVMEFIEGKTLGPEVWKSLTADGKAKIGTEFGQMFEKLQSVPSSGYYGRINHQGFSPEFYMLRTNYKEEIGPIYSYQELVDAIYETSKLSYATAIFGMPEYSGDDLVKLACMKKELTRAAGQEPRLTYLDPKWNNVVLKQVSPEEEIENTDFEVVFVDWFHLGWLPAWYQSTMLPMEETVHMKAYGHRDGWTFYWDIVKAMPSYLFAESHWIMELIAPCWGVAW